MTTLEKGSMKCGRHSFKLRIIVPESDEERGEFQKRLGLAYTEMAISMIKRRSKNHEERKALYQVLLDLKKSGKSI